MRLDNTLINEIKNKVDIVEVISSYVPLSMRGKNYFGVCPFHDDHSPSMSVSKEKQIYTCFSCGATGNVFHFIQNFEHISFLEAVKKCADMCGVTLDIKPNDDYLANNKNKNLYEMYELSQKFYQNNLKTKEGASARDYLTKRDITDDAIKTFDIGLSLDDYNMLVKLLEKKGFTDKDILKSGLANANDDGLYDIYRHRIMFPLHDIYGHVIGYNGRAYEGDITNKYVNSKETDIFKKRDFLYNYHRAKDAARAKKEIIIMEGPMDVIRAYSVGINNVVATLGTAFGSSQSNLIKRLSSNVILCFDGDAAGLKATKLAISELQKVGINPKIVRIPNDEDPDEFISKEGKDKFQELLDKAYDVMEFKALLIKSETNLSTAEGLANYVNAMISEINAIDDDILRSVTINRLVKESGLDKETILAKLTPTKDLKLPTPKKVSPKNRRYKESLNALIYYMLKDIDVIKKYDKSHLYIPDKNYRSLAFQISAFYKKYGYIAIADLMTELTGDDDLLKTLGEIEVLDSSSFSPNAIDDYIKNIQMESQKEERSKYQQQLYQAIDYDAKLALGNKLIADKLRSEEND